MLAQTLGAGHAAGQDDQVVVLGQHVQQHGVGGQAGAAGQGDHAASLDAGHHRLDLGAPQHVDQGHCFQVFHAFGDGEQGLEMGLGLHGVLLFLDTEAVRPVTNSPLPGELV
ncbi:hypothetical protein D9M68_751160 [compost metagenome]